MPENDLGTAHGRIKIDVDDRGAQAADRSLSKFARSMRQFQASMTNAQKTMQRFEQTVKQTAAELDKGDDSTRRSDSSLTRVKRTVDKTNTGFMHFRKELLQTWNWLNRVKDATDDVISPLAMLSRVLWGLNRNQSGLLGVFRVLGRTGALASGVGMLATSWLGMGRAMRDVPRWQRNLLKFASLTAGFLTMARLFRRVTGTVGPLDRAITRLGERMGVTEGRFGAFNRTIRRTPRAILGIVGGMALVRHGMSRLQRQFGFLLGMPPAMKLAFGAAFLGLQAAVQASAKSLVFLSNLVVGLVSSVKQLSGVALALPGAIATVAVAGLTLKAVFGGLTRLFEDVFKAETVEELDEALKNLPERFHSLARQLVDIKKRWIDFQDTLSDTALQGVTGQLEAIDKSYFSSLQKNMRVLANEFVETKNQLVGFLTEQQTVNDFGLAFQYTSDTVQNLNEALVPVLEGLRDITIVGMDFVRNFTGAAGGLAEKFAEWARLNRENGQLMRWMQDGVQGAKDLLSGLWDLTQALYTLLTLFADVDRSTDFLGGFADSMERFNNAVTNSAMYGRLADIRNAIQNMGTDKVDMFKRIWEAVSSALAKVWPFIEQVSQGFRETFLPILEKALGHFERFMNFFGHSQLGRIIGWVLGIVAGFKVLMFVLAATRSAMMILIGTFAFLRGAGTAVMAVSSMMGFLLGSTNRAATAVKGLGMFIRGLGGFIGVAMVAIAALFLIANQGNNEIEQTTKNIEANAKKVEDYADRLKKAFIADRGQVGGNVFDATKQSMDDMIQSADQMIREGPGWSAQVADFFDIQKKAAEWEGRDKEWGWGFDLIFTNSDELNAQQDAIDKAAQVQASFEELGATTEDMAAAVTGSETSFQSFRDQLLATENGGEAAAARLDEFRQRFVEMQEDFRTAGTGGAQLAAGIAKIGEAGGDATSKLEGLKLALEGLGLLKTSALEAAFAYSEAVRNLATEAQNAVDSTASLDDIFTAEGGLNTASVNAQNLFNVLKNVSDTFLSTVANGEDADTAFAQLAPRLTSLAEAFTPVGGNVDETRAKIEALISTMGVVPSQVDILMQLTGQDAVLRGMAQVALQAQEWVATGNAGVNIPIIVEDPQAVEQRIESIFGDIADSTDAGIKFKFDVNPEALNVLWAELAKQGIERNPDGTLALPPAEVTPAAPGAPATPAPATPHGPASTSQPQQPATPAPATPAPQEPAPAPAPLPVDQSAIDAANENLDKLKAKMEEIDKFDPRIDLTNTEVIGQTIDGFNNLKTKLDEIKSYLESGELKFHIKATGYDETTAVVNRVKDAVVGLVTEVNKIASAFSSQFSQAKTTIDTFATNVKTTFDTLAATMYDNGVKMITDLAQGMLDSKVKIDEAGHTIAQAVQDYLEPGSPTKKGPLSGHGYTSYSGAKIVEDFAAGMISSAGSVGRAGSAVAGSAGSAMQGPFDFGKMLGRIQDLVSFGSGIVDIIGQIADTIFNTMKFISDQMSGGKEDRVFGQHVGFRRDPSVSDDDLRRKREDEELAAQQTEHEGTGDEPGVSDSIDGLSEVLSGVQPGDEALLSMVPSGSYSQTGDADLVEGLGDCSSAVEDLVNMMDGRPTGGREMSTANAAEWLTQHGFIEGTGELGDFRVAFNSGHMQATLPGGTPFNWGSEAAANRGGIGGSGADDPSLTSRYYRPGDYIAANTAESVDQQEAILDSLRLQNQQLDEAITAGQDPTSSDEQVINALNTIQSTIDSQGTTDDANGRQQTQALESVKSEIMDSRGITTNQNPIDTASTIASSATSIAKDVFSVIEATMNSVGAAKNIADTLVRGIENSEDIYNMIDQVQEFINLAARIAGAVGSITSAVGAIGGAAGGMDMGASSAISAVGQISSLISGALDTINGIIDLGQEAYRIFGTYFGEFLGFLAGGASQLEGDVKFLLDQNDNTLKAYSRDNPEDKRIHPLSPEGQTQQAPQIGEVNVYGGPGQDPRDTTRNMMFAVRSAGMGAGGLN